MLQTSSPCPITICLPMVAAMSSPAFFTISQACHFSGFTMRKQLTTTLRAIPVTGVWSIFGHVAFSEYQKEELLMIA